MKSHLSEYHKAKIFDRIIAFLIDDFVSLLLIIPGVIWFHFFSETAIGNNLSAGFLTVLIYFKIDINIDLSLVGLLLFFTVSVAYNLLKDGFPNGQSIGKKKMSLMVVNVFDYKPCGLWRSLFRQIVRSIFFLVDVIMLFLSSTGRTLSDMIVGTQVINKNSIK